MENSIRFRLIFAVSSVKHRKSTGRHTLKNDCVERNWRKTLNTYRILGNFYFVKFSLENIEKQSYPREIWLVLLFVSSSVHCHSTSVKLHYIDTSISINKPQNSIFIPIFGFLYLTQNSVLLFKLFIGYIFIQIIAVLKSETRILLRKFSRSINFLVGYF